MTHEELETRKYVIRGNFGSIDLGQAGRRATGGR